MPLYIYTAADKDGNIRSSQMEAVDRATIISYLKDERLLVVSVKEKKEDLGQLFSNKVSALDKISLAGNLSIMLKSGVNMSEALDVISRDSKSVYFQKVCADIRFGLENGRPFSEGLSHFPDDFDNVFVSLVKSGEATGKLSEVLHLQSVQLKKDYSLNSKIRSAMAYPIVLVVSLIGVIMLLMIFVLPKLVALFESTNLKLPLGTRILFWTSNLLSAQPIVSIVVIILLAIALVILVRHRKTKHLFLNCLSHLPITASLLQEIELTRFTRTLGNLLKSGVPIVQAIEITASGLSLPAYKKVALLAKADVTKGVSLANAFDRNQNVFPKMLISVMQVGEKSSSLDALLFGLGDYYEEKVDNTLNNLTSLVEPVLLIVVGLAIGGIAVSIIMPIYQLIGSF